MGILKTNFILIINVSLLLNYGFVSAQNNHKKPVEMLETFYKAYNTAWATTKGNVLIKKLDSLQTKYCTLAFRKDLKKLFKKAGLDHDVIINDEYTDVKHLYTLKITKVLTKNDAYMISYIAPTTAPNGEAIEEKVIIYVTVTDEEGNYKIASAFGNAIKLSK